MKKLLLLVAMIGFVCVTVRAQDEGAIVKKERINLSKSIYLSGGPSFTFGKNIGDYSKGTNFELGFLSRINRVISIGGFLSYSQFKYDPKVTSAKSGAYYANGDPNDWGYTYDVQDLSYDYAWVLTLQGGNLNMASAGFTVKVNFIPIKDETKFSVYAFAKPFVTVASRKVVSGHGDRFTYETYVDQSNNLQYQLANDTWYPDGTTDDWGPDGYPALKSTTVTTGGIYIGPGVEYNPGKAFSAFLQAGFGYTLPVNYVSTQSYPATEESYLSDNFPIVKKGFPALNVQLGISYNF